MVASGTAGTNVSGGLVGGRTTYFDWALANYGPGDVHFNEGDRLVQIGLDGSPIVGFTAPSGGFTLQEGHYAYYEDFTVDDISAGRHTGELVGDPGGLVAESDEGDNSYSTAWTWGGGSARATGVHPWIRVPARGLRTAPIPAQGGDASTRAVRTAATMGVLYVPAAAHVSGAHGTNWRTDLEIHNPGAGEG
ncbi:MAG TPA: hypothetical protein ENK19_04505, partial [Acidobacteria bacterium]|nr:hypothetical protein [Acidobacteriota bacterium]